MAVTAARAHAVRPIRGHKLAQMEEGHSSSIGAPFVIPAAAAASSSEKGEGLFQGQARPLLPSCIAQDRDFGVSVPRQRKMHPTSPVPKHWEGLDHRALQPSLLKLPWGEQGQGS